MKKYFYTDGENKFGPFTIEELLEKNISRETKIWYYGLETWTPFNKLEESREFLQKLPPPIHILPPPIPSGEPTKIDFHEPKTLKSDTKPKWVNILVAIFILSLIVLAIWSISSSEKASEEVDYKAIVESAYEADEDFLMYVEKFYRDLNVLGIYPKKPSEVIIKFARLDQITNSTHVHAYSFGIYNDDLIEIYINPSSWEKFNKPKRYFLMYHELAHDVLNLDDLSYDVANEGKLMYPLIESYEQLTMDEFIESYQALFEEVASK